MGSRFGFDPSQPSSWRGIMWMIVGTGTATLPPQHMVWFLPLSMVVTGVLGTFVKDAPAVTPEASATTPKAAGATPEAPILPTPERKAEMDKMTLDELIAEDRKQ